MIFAFQLVNGNEVVSPPVRRRLRTRNQLTYAGGWRPANEDETFFRVHVLASLRKGLRAARQIAVPAMIVQAMILTLVLGYFYYPPAKDFFAKLVAFKVYVGPAFAFASMAVIALFVEFLRRFFGKEKPVDSFWKSAGYGVVVLGFLGVMTDCFYILQKWMWSGLSPAAQVPAKVFTDQFIYTVLLSNPYQTFLYVLKDCGFKPRVFVARVTPFKVFYVREVLAVLITNWAFWIPTGAILYTLPIDLQFVISRFAITIWVLLLMVMTRREKS